MALTIYNTLAREKQLFKPLDPTNVRMYVCGPTVYDFAHIGNARPVIVFDVLFRLLRHIYGEKHVTYVRNITDVEDKIIARAAERKVSIRELTEGTAKVYQEDALALGNLPPTLEPRVTDTMPEIIAMIATLVENKHAYVAEGHVLFDVSSNPGYGKLSRRALDEMIAGARVEVAPYKRSPMDFVLWKPSEATMPGWDSPWGNGRPGWHIECSAMGEKHLGETFDIHAGGIDLIFPHHENEIAQSEGSHHGKPIANYWMHNGFLQVEGEKMSKSLGNFITIRELLAEKKFGDQQWHGRVLRLAMLGTHYRQPTDWTVDRLLQTRATLMEWARLLHGAPSADTVPDDIMAALSDDLNTPAALAAIHGLASSARTNEQDRRRLKAALNFLSVYADERDTDFLIGQSVDAAKVETLIAQRNAARKAKNFAEADKIRVEIAGLGVAIEDGASGTTWKVIS
ncbi:MAG: cysteine--tRNA ligase [Alphaproteobacteria bacterium]|nr:cysteine--tRNA ligase [Alphaproteobacteria bacterium]